MQRYATISAMSDIIVSLHIAARRCTSLHHITAYHCVSDMQRNPAMSTIIVSLHIASHHCTSLHIAESYRSYRCSSLMITDYRPWDPAQTSETWLLICSMIYSAFRKLTSLYIVNTLHIHKNDTAIFEHDTTIFERDTWWCQTMLGKHFGIVQRCRRSSYRCTSLHIAEAHHCVSLRIADNRWWSLIHRARDIPRLPKACFPIHSVRIYLI